MASTEATSRTAPTRWRQTAAGWTRRSNRLRRSLLARLHPHRQWLAIPLWLIRGYQRVNAADLAAALAYNALIVLIPLILLLVSIGGLALQAEGVMSVAIHAVLWAVPTQDADAAVAALVQARQDSRWFALGSLLGFAWVGANFVNSLSRAMNRIYGVPDRHFVHERIRAFALVLLLAILTVLAAVAATVPTLFVAKELGIVLDAWAIASAQTQAISYLAAFVTALALFFFVYRVLPNADQRLRDVWPGSVVAALIFVALLQAFPIYLRLTGGAIRYGAFFGFIPLIVVWFALLAHLVLFGAFVNASYQRECRGDGEIAKLPLPGCDDDERTA